LKQQIKTEIDNDLQKSVLGERPSFWTNKINLLGLLRTAFESDL